jgi:hypothetical protein
VNGIKDVMIVRIMPATNTVPTERNKEILSKSNSVRKEHCLKRGGGGRAVRSTACRDLSDFWIPERNITIYLSIKNPSTVL